MAFSVIEIVPLPKSALVQFSDVAINFGDSTPDSESGTGNAAAGSSSLVTNTGTSRGGALLHSFFKTSTDLASVRMDVR